MIKKFIVTVSTVLIALSAFAPALAQQPKPAPAQNATPRPAAQNLCTVEGKSFPTYVACVEHFALIAEKNGTGRSHDHHDRDCRLAGCK